MQFCSVYMRSTVAVCYGKTEEDVINFGDLAKEMFKLRVEE